MKCISFPFPPYFGGCAIKLKDGDVVVCTDADDDKLESSKIYIVEWVNGVNIKLFGVPYATKVSRFKHVNEVM